MINLEQLLAQMTFEEKVGQLVQYNADVLRDTGAGTTGPRTELGLTPQQLSYVGNVLNFSSPKAIRAIQDEHLAKDRNRIPIVFMMDVIHGFRTIYPVPLALGCSFDEALVAECSRLAAREAATGGVQVTFTPMVDYVRDARWGRVMETCGEDPLLNSRMGAVQVKAFQGEDLSDKESIAACVKHFAAYGGAEAGRDYNTVELSEHALREFYLPAYKACIDAGAEMVMASFNTLNGIPATVHPWLMQELLRKEWGFDGVVISDFNAIGELLTHGVAQDRKEAAKLAFQNGCDIEMCSSTYFHHLQELVEEGVISLEQIDTAVLRVLRLKEKLGLFEDPYHGAAQVDEPEDLKLSTKSRDVARRAAESCAVLLKNTGILPLSEKIRKIALIGPMAAEHKIIGTWSCHGRWEESVTVEEGIRSLMPNAQITVVQGCGNQWNDTDRSGFTEAVDAARNADAVVLCLGEPQEYSGEGNCRTDIVLPGPQNALAEAVAAVNPNTVALTFSGRPLNLSAIEETVPAILHMWLPGTEGGNAAANLLFGRANPSGKLSMSFPRTVGQCPIYYNHTNTGRPKRRPNGSFEPYTSGYIDCGNLPLYSFGYGLSYSNFVYEGMTLSAGEMTADGSIRVDITVRNDSDVSGKETVMLYLRDLVASNARPIQQLIDFQKVDFGPGERKVISFTVTEPMLRFWNNENKLVSEPGAFQISTGYADHLLYTREIVLK